MHSAYTNTHIHMHAAADIENCHLKQPVWQCRVLLVASADARCLALRRTTCCSLQSREGDQVQMSTAWPHVSRPQQTRLTNNSLTLPTNTAIPRPLHNLCQSVAPAKNWWRTLLEQSFNVHMPLLMATSTLRLPQMLHFS